MKERKNKKTTSMPKESRVILTGNHKLFVENYDKVLKFEPNAILLFVGKRRLLIKGENLWLERYDKFDLMIKGMIYAIEFPENQV